MQPIFENLEYEKAILGIFLAFNNEIDNTKIESGDFTQEINRNIFNTIKAIHLKNNPINIQTVSIGLCNTDSIYVSSLTNYNTSNATLDFYERELKTLRLSRSLRSLGIRTSKEAGVEEPEKIISNIEEKLTELSMNTDKEHSILIRDCIPETIDKIEKAFHNKGKLNGITTGFDTLDDMIDGFQNSEFVIIGARTSIGKSAISFQMAVAAAKSKNEVGFLSLEMPINGLSLRLLSGETNINQKSLKRGFLQQKDFASLIDAGDRIFPLPLYVFDKPSLTLEEIISESRWLKRKHNVKIIFIDYLGLIKYKDTDIPRWQQFVLISAAIKQLARELEIPIVGVAQVGRQGEGRSPTLADLRDSGSLEQDADIVMLLNRDRKDENGEAELEVAKCRNGETGIVKLRFMPNITKFYELEKHLTN